MLSLNCFNVCRKYNLCLVIGVGIAFLLVFTAFSAASQADASVLEGARKEKGPSFTASGYVSLAIVYATCAISNWFSPLIVSWLKPKYSMFVGALTFVFYLTTFFEPITWLIYFSSAVLGCGAAVLWTAQGVYVTACSTPLELHRHFGIFWIFFTISNLVGSFFTYFRLSNVTSITSEVRIPMYSVFTAICSAGCVLFLLLPLPKSENVEVATEGEVAIADTNSRSLTGRISTLAFLRTNLTNSFRLLKSRVMLAILLATCFTGVNLTFFSGVYGTCLSRMLVFGDRAKSYIGLAGIFIGIGEIIGGQLTAFASTTIGVVHRHSLFRSSFVMFIGFFSAILSAVLAFLMIPPLAPISETSAVAYIDPSVYLAMFIAFLLGFNDSLWNTQLSALIGKVYPTTVDSDVTAAAFALFKFAQSVTSAMAFFYSSVLLLHWQLTVFVFLAASGICSFLFANQKSAPPLPSRYQSPPTLESVPSIAVA